MRRPPAPHRPAPGAAFTLAEVAVTLALVGLALVWMMQALQTAKMTAAQTRNLKLGRELALLTLGQIESGLYEDEVEDERIEGTYASEGYPDFYFEAVIGDENFRERDPETGAFFDNWRHERDLADDDDEESEQPYETVSIKVFFPKIGEMKNEVLIERWLPWKQVHRSDEDDAGSSEGGEEDGA